MADGEATYQLPEQLSTSAAQVDWLYYFIYWLSVVMFVGIVSAAIYFVWKYRRQPGVKSEPTGHNTALEAGWTIAPLFLLVLLFHWGFKGYMEITVAPADAIEIKVTGRKWGWSFEYPNGGVSGELHVPVNRPVRLSISSVDVLHAFYVPGFRVKRDAVPGRYGMLWFQATKIGETEYYCAEYCGASDAPTRNDQGEEVWSGHFSMHGRVHVETQEAFERFAEELNGPHQGESLEQYGQRLYRENQCFTCHSVDGAPGTGPTFRGLMGRRETLSDGSTVLVDDAYITSSILNPTAQIVQGYQPVMPTFRGTLRERQLNGIIAYLRTLH